MPTTPTAQPGLLPVPGAPDVPVIAVDLGADGLTPQVRRSALERLRTAGLEDTRPGPGVPPAAPGWTAMFSDGRLVLRSPAHVIYDGDLTLWPALAEAITANGWVLVYVGHLALGWGADALAAVRTAAACGQCTGGIVQARLHDQESPVPPTTPAPDAIRQVLRDHLTGRVAWDEPPALFLFGPVETGCILVPLAVPEEAWGHPATVMDTLADELEADPAARRAISQGDPPLWGVALRHEAFNISLTPEQARARAASVAFGLTVPPITEQTPGRVEIRAITALDTAGGTYDLVMERGSSTVDERRSLGEGGRIPAALRRLLNAFQD